MGADWFNHHRLLAPIGNVPPAEYEKMHYDESNRSCKAAWLKLTGLRNSRGGSITPYAAWVELLGIDQSNSKETYSLLRISVKPKHERGINWHTSNQVMYGGSP